MIRSSMMIEVLYKYVIEQSRSQFHIHSAAGAAAAAASLCAVTIFTFFSICYVDTVCGFATEHLDLIDYNYYTVRCCTTYEYTFVYTCLLMCYTAVAAAVAAAAASSAAFRHRVPDGEICSRGSLHPISVCSFSSFKHDNFQCTPWQYYRIFNVDFLPITIYISCILGITGMRGAKAGVSSPQRSPPCFK